MRLFKPLPFFFSLFGALTAAGSAIPSGLKAEYDYVVVGAGAGGGPLAARLAENGYSVLLVNVGKDVHSINTTIPFYFTRAAEDPALELAYNVNEYPAGFRYQRNNVWYPRAKAIGGSTVVNALLNVIAETRSDLDGLATMFNDTSFSRSNMQKYFKKIENVQYPTQNGDHGTDGWFKTNQNPGFDKLDPSFVDAQSVALFESLAGSGPLVPDLNSIAGDNATGVNIPSFSIDGSYNRSSVRERLMDVNQAKGSKLQFTYGLATKILLKKASSGKPVAYGVQIAKNAFLPVDRRFNGKVKLDTWDVVARREVIISAGAFQSPQLLMLSGIGDRAQLKRYGIKTVVHLPGVGRNLQDHDEVAAIWRMKQNFSLFNGCTILPTREQDPCLGYWADKSKMHLYSFGPALALITAKTREEYTEPDMLTYITPAFFPGFVPGFPQMIADHHDAVSAISLKAHASSKGTVSLTGSHPQDPLKIEKQHFQDKDGPRDVADLRESLKRSRQIMESNPVSLHIKEEVVPGPNVQTDAQIEDYIYKHVFGHHACCTVKLGKDNDPMAVLDGKFQVRGVKNLRVVDASSLPVVPGFYVTTLYYMLSEKVADMIMAKAIGNAIVNNN